VLQGVYQAHQATAAACQINNLHLLRGMIRRPGCGVLQFNGQPTAQNTRETGADGDLPGFRNWDNKEHVQELADLWNVDLMKIPHWAPPTHAMQIWRYAEQGSIEFLWISGTNPAVSLPELHCIRDILKQENLFVVVQDIFRTETARLADVVLPAATWGEKTGTYTNTDRTVHLSEAAVSPPGEAKHDLDIFLEYVDRMSFEDNDGEPLIKWRHPEEAFEAWKECTRGRPCDYTGITYEKLRGGSGVQWPCNEEHREGTERLHADGDFNTRTENCETYGHDLLTGAVNTEDDHRAMSPDGRTFLKAVAYTPPHEEPDEDYPFGAYDLPLPHPYQDREGAAAPERGPGRVGGDPPLRRRSAGRRRGRCRPRRVPAWGPGGEGAYHRDQGGPSLRAVSLRALRRDGQGFTGRPPQGGQRADYNGVGPRLEAAALQGGRREGYQGC
jgi:ferredoxin-nitrate reductase